ncbi:unnamed protein product, partial [Meganyctiphanes norvegica]
PHSNPLTQSIMKVLLIVLVASLAAAQQFQFRRQNNFQRNSLNRNNYSPHLYPAQSSFVNNNRFRNNRFFNYQNRNQFQNNNFRQQNQNLQSHLNDYQNEIFGVFEPLNLPSGASAMMGDISSTFSCADRPYGYYADVENFCSVYHICN